MNPAHRYADTVAAIDALGPSMAAMSDAQLAAQTSVLRQRLATGVPLDALLVEAFAVVREAASRVVGQRHFLVQLVRPCTHCCYRYVAGRLTLRTRVVVHWPCGCWKQHVEEGSLGKPQFL